MMRRLSMVLLMTLGCSPSSPNHRPPDNPPPPGGKRVLTVDQYEELVYGPGPKATFAATTAIEHQAIEALIPKLLEGARSATPPDPLAWQAEAAAGGFRIEVWSVGNETYWALLEAQPTHGAGAYIVRVSATQDTGPMILLEAPHNFFDMGTGRLAADLFFTPRKGARPRALFTNTMHRYQQAPGDKRKRKNNPADVAHQPDHAFTIATVAFARVADHVRVSQVHGFGQRIDEGDNEGVVSDIDMVVSAGEALGSTPTSAAIADALVKVFGTKVKRYPEEAKVLGATTNAQGKLLRGLPNSRFIHVEMSGDLRKQLAGDAALRERFAVALFDTGDPP